MKPETVVFLQDCIKGFYTQEGHNADCLGEYVAKKVLEIEAT